VRGREVISRIEKAQYGQNKACELLRIRGSHHIFECSCGEEVCKTSVPNHGSKDLGTGLLHDIEKDLEPCLGKGWLLG
jgi:predicted RNA binding protein YcfA (HicA-like mRNA interferase family)